MSHDRARPVLLEADAAVGLRVALAEWTVDSIGERLDERAMEAFSRENVAPALLAARALEADRTVALTRLFLLGDEVSARDFAAAVPEAPLDVWVAAGLVQASGRGRDDAVRALVDLRPTSALTEEREQTFWVASDQTEAVTRTVLAPDHVLGVGGASSTLANVTMRRPVGRVLDLGTGCGIQALHATGHSSQVVATDVSRRALAFARFNALLNDVAGQVELREGSLLEPVAGDQFDLVVSNPPFVITAPGTPRYEYRSGDAPGDSVVRGLIENVGAVLAPGGVAQMLGNWEITATEDWASRVESWVEASSVRGVPLDAWVLQRDTLDPTQYAETWLRDAGLTPERDWDGYLAATRAYLEDFEARGVTAVGFGVVLLRRAHGEPTLRRLEQFDGPLPDAMGAHVASVLDAHDWLAQTSDQALRNTALCVAGDVTEERYTQPGASDPTHILIRQGGGMGRSFVVDTVMAGLVGVCDGELTLGQICHAMAALLDVDAGELTAGALPRVRDLVRDGVLVS